MTEPRAAGVPTSTPAAAVVVTGASRWLEDGSRLPRTLVGQRDRVRCPRPHRRRRRACRLLSPSVEVVVGDVRDATVDRLFDGVGADAAVFHAAAVIHPVRSARSSST